MDLSFMDQSVEVASASAPEPEPEQEPEPKPPPTTSFVGDDSVEVDIGKGAFQQHDLSATALLLESSPDRVECVATSSENLDHTVYIFKVFTPDGRVWSDLHSSDSLASHTSPLQCGWQCLDTGIVPSRSRSGDSHSYLLLPG